MLLVFFTKKLINSRSRFIDNVNPLTPTVAIMGAAIKHPC